MHSSLRILPLFATAFAVVVTLQAQNGATPGSTPVTAVLPNGREIHPAGNWIPLAPYPFAIAVSPNGAQVAVPSIGFPFALNIVSLPDTAKATVTRMPAGQENDPKMEVHAGLAYSPDSALLYVATGDSGKIRAYSTPTGTSREKSRWTGP
jgi:DNA-binding beta-propeller fold protein YncE